MKKASRKPSKKKRDRSAPAAPLTHRQGEFRPIFDSAREPIFLLSLTADLTPGKFIDSNPMASRRLGYSREEFRRLSPVDLHDPGSAFDHSKIQKSLKARGHCLFQARFKTKDGTPREMEISLTVIKIRGRKVALAICRDLAERKRAEEQYRTIIQTTMDGFWVVDMAGRFLDVNDAYCRLIGYRREELLKMGIRDVEAIETPEGTMAHVRKIMETGGDRFETKHRCKDGRIIDVEVSVNYFKEAGWMFVFLRDITEGKKYREQLEKLVSERTEALRESEEKYRTLFHLADEAIIIGRESYAEYNRKALELFGCSTPEQLANKTPFDLSPPIQPDGNESLKKSTEIIEKALTGESQFFYWQHRRMDGTLVDTHVSLTRMVIGGEPVLLGIIHDITEQKRAEADLERYRKNLEELVRDRTTQLKRSEEIFRIAAQSTNDLIYDWDIVTNRLEWHGNIDRTLGYESGEFPRTLEAWEDAIHPDDRDRVMDALRRHVENREEYNQEYRIRKKNGEYAFWTDRGTSLRDQNGKAYRMIGSCADITLHKQMEAELLKAQKLESIGVLAGGIAHDFNNLLTGILGHLSLARYLSPDGSKLSHSLEEAEKSCLRAKGLTQQLLTFARGGAPVKKVAELGPVIKDAAAFALHGSRVNCVLSIPDNLWPAEIDEGQVSQAVDNIVLNAEQAMPEGGTITISAGNVVLGAEVAVPLKSGNYLRISISDQGIGIGQEHLSNIFDPYFTTKQKGRGLGLTIAYSILKNHGGAITVESTLGRGTIFHLFLPAAPGARPRRKAPETKPVRGSGMILVVDDEETVRETARDILVYLGYEVSTAGGSEEAVRLYSEARAGGNPFSAVIMDLTMPGDMDGRKATERLREIDAAVKVIVSSGYSVGPIMSDYKNYGFMGAIAKPYKIQELSEVLMRVIRNP